MKLHKMNLEEELSIPPDKYLAKVIDVTEAISKTENRMLVFKWKIIKGIHEGKMLTSYVSLQDHARGTLIRYLKAFGYKGKVTVNTDDLKGKQAYIVVDKRIIPDADGDKEYPRVREVLPFKTAKTQIVEEEADDDGEDDAEDSEESDDKD